jgi:5-methylthioadenosine/S-adenosylhomocysteine deaminase
VIDVKGEKAVMPGFVNCHTHSAMSLLRGCADDLPLKEWLFDKIFPIEEKLTPEDIYWGTKLALIEMIKSGTTTINEMYLSKGFNETVKAIDEIKMRAVIGICFSDESFEEVKKIKEFKKTELMNYAIAPHAIYTVSKEGLEWARDFSKEKDMLIHMHLSETLDEVNYSIDNFGKKPVEYLNDIGLLNNRCVFAHAIWLDNNEIELLKEKECNLVYNPCSNMKLASGIFRFEEIKEKGINICLGTDGSASNDNLDMFEEMKMGALLQKVNNVDPTSCNAHQIIKTATENGAKALRLNTGKIEEGMLADLILIDLKKIYFTPCYDFISDLVYASNGECVADTICNGKFLMRDRVIEGEKEVIEKVKQILNKF